MLASVKSFALEGLDGYAVDVEVDVNSGLPAVETVGLASTATKESKERVRAAIRNSGFPYPMKRITVNLAPADTKKEGAALDLPIAVGLLVCAEAVVTDKYKDFVLSVNLRSTVRCGTSTALCRCSFRQCNRAEEISYFRRQTPRKRDT